MNKNCTIVYMSTIDWDFSLQQRPHHIMRLLSERGYTVAWLNTEKTCRQNENQRRIKVNDKFHVYNNPEVFKKRYKNPDIYFSSWAERYNDLYEITPKVGVIYDSLDNFEANQHNELNMLKYSDVVLTTSQSLYRLQKKHHNNVHMCPNACFTSFNKKYEVPNDLKPFKDKPIVLFSGALAQWCDVDLLEAVGNQFQLIMVGIMFGISRIPSSIHYLGSKSYEDLQAYYHNCDITLLPFNKRQEAVFSDPIKIYESLAHSKICVSTDIEEAKKFHPKVVLCSKTRQAFVNNIKKALSYSDSEITKQLCLEEATKHTWDKRVDVIEEQIEKLRESKK